MSANIVVLGPQGDAMTFTGVTHMSVHDGTLELVEKTETVRTVPVSILWGLIQITRTIKESKTVGIAVFAREGWTGCWNEGYGPGPGAKRLPAEPTAD